MGEEIELSDTHRQEQLGIRLGEGEKYLSGDYIVDEKQRTIGVTDEGWETIEKALGIGNIADAENWELKHYVETAHQGARALQARCGLRGEGRRGDYRGHLHRPPDAGTPLERRAAPVHRGQGRREHPQGRPDAGHHHVPELFSPLSKTERHDRHGRDRSGRVRKDLQAGDRCHPHQQAAAAARKFRCRFPHREGKIQSGGRQHRGAARKGAAGAGGHHVDREVGAAVGDFAAQGRAACGAEREVPRARGGDCGAGGAPGDGDHRHQHGRPRHGYSAGRQRGVHGPPGTGEEEQWERARHQRGRGRHQSHGAGGFPALLLPGAGVRSLRAGLGRDQRATPRRRRKSTKQ